MDYYGDDYRRLMRMLLIFLYGKALVRKLVVPIWEWESY